MPSYALNGFFLSHDSNGADLTTPMTFSANYAAGVTTTSYEFINIDDSAEIRITSGVATGTFLDGVRIRSGQGDFFLATTEWGAGRDTNLLFIDIDKPGTALDGEFIAFLDADAVPAFVANDSALFEEFFRINWSGGPLNRGAFLPDTTIALADFFAPVPDGAPITGTAGANVITGTGQDDLIVGRAGSDRIDGRGGRDTIMLGKGSDTGFGGKDWDVISGFGGNDTLYGGAGNDDLLGGRGNDLLRGGTGGDYFIFDRGTGQDIIADFNLANDVLSLNVELWMDGTNNFNAAEVIARFADVVNGDVVFDFGTRGRITLDGVGTLTDPRLEDALNIFG